MGRSVAIGLMSGTSLDGVDVALIETDGTRIHAFGPTLFSPYTEPERALLRAALVDGAGLTHRNDRPGVLAEAEGLITESHAAAVERFLAASGLAAAAIDVIGFHGQTVLHRPDDRLTVQIGDGAGLAARLGVPVVFDFRAADVAAGGQGAPLVPVFHRALAEGLAQPGPVAVLNIGGVANVTYVDGPGDPIACDTGPGNALIDDFMHARTGNGIDHGGQAAAAGLPDQAFLDWALTNPFFAVACPKSLDRNAFNYVQLGLPPLSVEDGAATLTALTAASAAGVVRHLPRPPRRWIVAGGGAQNPTLMRMLTAQLAPATVETADQVGWSADALEAQAFAFLAVRRLYGLPISFPTTTGVPAPLTGGVVATPRLAAARATG